MSPCAFAVDSGPCVRCPEGKCEVFMAGLMAPLSTGHPFFLLCLLAEAQQARNNELYSINGGKGSPEADRHPEICFSLNRTRKRRWGNSPRRAPPKINLLVTKEQEIETWKKRTHHFYVLSRVGVGEGCSLQMSREAPGLQRAPAPVNRKRQKSIFIWCCLYFPLFQWKMSLDSTKLLSEQQM